MGLAASQARLLMITARITDCQYDLMKLSGETLKLSAQTSDLDEEYEWKLNCLTNMSYDGNMDFTYSDLMGSNGYASGSTSPVLITNTDGNVVMDDKYSQAMRKAQAAESLSKFGVNVSANLITDSKKPTQAGFNAFMSSITGDAETDWWSAYKGSTTTVTPTPVADKNDDTDVQAQYLNARSEFINQYGSKPQIGGTWSDAPKYRDDILEPIDFLPNDKFSINEYPKFDADEEGQTYTPYTNEKGYNYSEWCSNLRSFASTKGLQYTHLLNGTYPTSSSGSSSTGTTTTTSSVVTKPDTSSDNYKKAAYYYQIYASALTSGWTQDSQVTDRSYMVAQLENNNYKIGGNYASENDKVTEESITEEQKDNVKAWYEKELKVIKNLEKRNETKQTQVQAQLSALTTEQESVQSLIDKNIERSFTYCQNG